jgi:hypothetical protein
MLTPRSHSPASFSDIKYSLYTDHLRIDNESLFRELDQILQTSRQLSQELQDLLTAQRSSRLTKL